MQETLKNYPKPVPTFLQLEKFNFIIVSSWIILWTPSHQHDEHHLASFLKHFKIFHAQPKAPKVCANTYNTENSFCLNLKTNDPQNLSSCKLNIWELYFMHSHYNKMQPSTLSDFIGFWASSLVLMKRT
jgi:hypothetical protein